MRHGEGGKTLGTTQEQYDGMEHSNVWGKIGEKGEGDGDNASGVKKNNMFKSTSTGKRGEREKGGKEKKTTTFQWGWIASGRGRKTSAGRTGRGEWALHRFKVLYQSSFAWRGGACHPRMSLKPNQSKILHDLEWSTCQLSSRQGRAN